MTANTERIRHRVSAADPPLSRFTTLFANTVCSLIFSPSLSLDDCLIQSRMAPNHNLQTKNSLSTSSKLKAYVGSDIAFKLVSPRRSWTQP